MALIGLLLLKKIVSLNYRVTEIERGLWSGLLMTLSSWGLRPPRMDTPQPVSVFAHAWGSGGGEGEEKESERERGPGRRDK